MEFEGISEEELVMDTPTMTTTNMEKKITVVEKIKVLLDISLNERECCKYKIIEWKLPSYLVFWIT